MTIEQLAKMEAAMSKGPWSGEPHFACHSEITAECAKSDGSRGVIFETRCSVDYSLENEANSHGVAVLRNHFRALLEVVREAEKLAPRLKACDTLRAALAALKEIR